MEGREFRIWKFRYIKKFFFLYYFFFNYLKLQRVIYSTFEETGSNACPNDALCTQRCLSSRGLKSSKIHRDITLRFETHTTPPPPFKTRYIIVTTCQCKLRTLQEFLSDVLNFRAVLFPFLIFLLIRKEGREECALEIFVVVKMTPLNFFCMVYLLLLSSVVKF